MDYQQLIKETALDNERMIVMTAENRALVRELPALLGKRFIDTGITEQTMIGMAAGLALRGRIPICHALTTFLIMRAFEFIRTDVGIPALPVKLSGFIPGFLSDANGPTHQALEDVALMRGIPNMEVYCPAGQEDMVGMLPDIWSSESPAYVRIVTRNTGYDHAPFEKGKAEIIAFGDDINILVYGFLFSEAMKTKEILEGKGLSVGLINMRSLKPVDENIITQLAASGSLMITMEDHFICGGLYTIVAEVLLKNQLTATVLPFAMKDKWFRPALLDAVLEYEGFTGRQMADKILMTYSNKIKNAQYHTI
ncbi:MAG: transketolase [Saprospiraceae bacterium]|nr:transketolase [Saprospiraceae bacterium]